MSNFYPIGLPDTTGIKLGINLKSKTLIYNSGTEKIGIGNITYIDEFPVSGLNNVLYINSSGEVKFFINGEWKPISQPQAGR